MVQIRALQQPGQPGLLGKIIGLYLASSQVLPQKLRKAVTASNSEALRQAAHGFKSSNTNLEATQLAALCGEL